jgi:hypothetical protein
MCYGRQVRIGLPSSHHIACLNVFEDAISSVLRASQDAHIPTSFTVPQPLFPIGWGLARKV